VLSFLFIVRRGRTTSSRSGGAPPVSCGVVRTMVGLVATPWNMDGRGGVDFRADSITPVTAGTPAGAQSGAGGDGA